MDTPQITAPPCAQSRTPGDVTPSSGVIHVNVRHIAGFTVIGNHLSQHRGLSLVAIGLAVHIQSLPAGARIGIKVLANRFPESETRIAAALRELEATGYLHRSRVRLTTGRIITRTVSYNQPGAKASTTAVPEPRPRPRPSPRAPTARPAPVQASQPPVTTPPSTPAQPSPPAQPAPPMPQPKWQPEPVLVPPPTARTQPLAPLPQPQTPTPELHQSATVLLADLRRHAPQLVLSENDVHTLAPGVATWLERNAHPDTIRHTLTKDLPIPLKHPAKLLRHRITTLLPPPLPGTHDLVPLRHRATPIPFQECEDCGRPFRSRTQHPTRCRDCHEDLQAAA